MFGIGILILMILHWVLFPSKANGFEGFFDSPSEYDILRSRLQKTMGPYCKMSDFVRSKVEEMQKGLGGNASDINQIYVGVYQCTDQLASTRPSCSLPNRTGMRFVPCSVYMDLPEWSDDSSAINTLRKIKDDLPERLIRESEWFAAVMKKLQEGLAAGANPAAGSNPVGVPPTMDQMNAYKEGFSGSCSAEASEYLRQQQIAKEAANCSSSGYVVPTPSSEIARVNALLDNPSVRGSVSQMNSMMSTMLKLQSDLEKLKNGTLYDWQKDGPKKVYTQFEGGDRSQSLVFSLKQNMNAF